MTKPRRGEVWMVRFDPTVGAEIRKTRPAVVMNLAEVGRLPLFIVVPITAWSDDYEEVIWLVPLDGAAESGLSKRSAADAFQVKSVSAQRFTERLGALPPERIAEIAAAVAMCVGHTGSEGGANE